MSNTITPDLLTVLFLKTLAEVDPEYSISLLLDNGAVVVGFPGPRTDGQRQMKTSIDAQWAKMLETAKGELGDETATAPLFALYEARVFMSGASILNTPFLLVRADSVRAASLGKATLGHGD